MRWVEFERRQPQLAARATAQLIEPGVLLVGTTRVDGTPRISPVEPLLMDGDLWLSMLWGSRKAQDLLRDDRVLVHNIVTSRDGRDGEVIVRGRARAVDDEVEHDRYAQVAGRTLGWQPEPGRFHLFVIDIDSVVSIRYGDHGDQYLTRWPPGSEQVRRGTSATSVGDPEPIVDLLDPTEPGDLPG
jgi:hypothetical protein